MKKPTSQLACPIEKTLRMIAGKWKTIILWYLGSGTKRYGELKKLIPEVSEKMLTQSLRELETDKLVKRRAYPEVPPRVDYTLTKKGQSLSAVICTLESWGKKNA